MVFDIKYAQANVVYLIEELGIRKPIRWVHEKVTGKPIMFGHVMILREESASNPEHPCDFLQSGFPVRHVVQYGKIKDGVEHTLLVGEIGDITHYDGCSVAVISEPAPRSISHLGINVDSGDAGGAKVLQLSYDALTGTAADVEDI
jgi:hypothetical protein